MMVRLEILIHSAAMVLFRPVIHLDIATLSLLELSILVTVIVLLLLRDTVVGDDSFSFLDTIDAND